MSRNQVTVTAFMYVVDDETFGSNEAGTAQMTRVAIVTDDQPSDVMHLEKGVGGEVRVELDLNAVALSNGDVRVEGDAKLYEGTSEQTMDLDGQRLFTVLVPRDRFVSRHVTIRNDAEGGDFANIVLNFSNRVA